MIIWWLMNRTEGVTETTAARWPMPAALVFLMVTVLT